LIPARSYDTPGEERGMQPRTPLFERGDSRAGDRVGERARLTAYRSRGVRGVYAQWASTCELWMRTIFRSAGQGARQIESWNTRSGASFSCPLNEHQGLTGFNFLGFDWYPSMRRVIPRRRNWRRRQTMLSNAIWLEAFALSRRSIKSVDHDGVRLVAIRRSADGRRYGGEAAQCPIRGWLFLTLGGRTDV